jgi:hypothetical protein
VKNAQSCKNHEVVNLLLADPPAPSSPDRPTIAPSSGGAPEQPTAPQRACANCGAELQGAQEWCLQCGTGAPGSIGGSAWRGPTAVILALVLLVAGAAVAGAAALTRHKAPPAVLVKTVAQAPTATVPTGTATTPTGAATTPVTPGFSTPTTPKSSIPKIPAVGSSTLPKGSTKVPALPFFNTQTKPSASTKQPTTTSPAATTPKETTTPSGSTGNGSTGTTPKPSPILLDTDAASTYNPYNYPEANFGEPVLAIDGDPGTAWTAQVEPTVAPRMAEGLVIDLKSAHHLELLELQTTTPGATVEVYGSDAKTVPTSITDPAWAQLAAPHVIKKTAKLKLHSRQHAYRYVVVWFTKAPAASVGTAQAPGHVTLSELALFPLAS